MPAKYTAEQQRAAFWSKVDKNGPIPTNRPDLGPCWLWTASLTKGGYGQLHVVGMDCLAHRAAYAEVKGPIGDGLDLDHLCRVRRCVNPDHVEPVPRPVNVRRGNGYSGLNARKTHCARGHAYSPENTYTGRGHRECRACNRERARERWERKRGVPVVVRVA